MESDWLGSQEHFINAPKNEQEIMREWFNARPLRVQQAIMKNPPWKLYKIGDSGEAFGTIYSFDEGQDGSLTCRINIFGNTFMPGQVFGVNPDDLIEVKNP